LGEETYEIGTDSTSGNLANTSSGIGTGVELLQQHHHHQQCATKEADASNKYSKQKPKYTLKHDVLAE
jgi:hypothetical protein